MAKNNDAFPTGNAMEEGFSEGQDLMSAQGNSGAGPTDPTWPKGVGPEELEDHSEDPEDPCRSALMDCYNR